MRIIAVPVLVAAAAFFASDAGARCLKYEPTRVTLSGALEARNVAGPPNYRSLARGDLPQTIYVLVLDEPICVNGNPTSAQNRKGHTNVGEVQLVVKPARAKALAGKRVRATGGLSASQGGQHRTPVVLTVAALGAS
jgi:hypothetical protein